MQGCQRAPAQPPRGRLQLSSLSCSWMATAASAHQQANPIQLEMLLTAQPAQPTLALIIMQGSIVTITSAAFVTPTATKFFVEIYFKMYPTCSVLKTVLVNFIWMPSK